MCTITSGNDIYWRKMYGKRQITFNFDRGFISREQSTVNQ